MNYTILIHETPENFAARSDPQQHGRLFSDIGHYLQALKAAGVYVGGAGLQPPEIATSIRMRNGGRMVQDGPFADTKEQLGGFFLINVRDRDAAIHWASLYPIRGNEVVELRPNLPPVE